VTGPGSRDWDKEMAEIDKIIAKAPPAQPTAPGTGAPALPAPRQAAGPPPAPSVSPAGRGGSLGTWLKVLLGGALAVGMTQWPYFHACGTGLLLYLGATGVVLIAGLWAAVGSWRRRMPLAHTISLGVLLAGGILAAREVLPRIGYARHSAVWWCP
jgi:hypothetical protein